MSYEPGVLGVQTQSSFLDNIDWATVIHAVVVVVIILVLYHLFFHR